MPLKRLWHKTGHLSASPTSQTRSGQQHGQSPRTARTPRLRPQYPGINHKRVYRIHTAEGPSIMKRKKIKRVGVRLPIVAALAVNQTWEAWTL